MNRRIPIEAAIAAIAVVDRLREPDPRAVAALQADIAERGLRQPIEITPETTADTSWRLVSGAHRLAACTALGWTRIPAFELEGTEDELRRDELMENLARSELSALERAIFAAELRCLWQQAHPGARPGGDRRSDGYQDRIVRSWFPAAAERTGWSETTLQRAATIGSQLDCEAVRALRGTPVEHQQADLDKLSRLGSTDQRAVARIIRDRGARTYAAALAAHAGPVEPIDPDQALLDQFAKLWGRASDGAKALIRDHVAGEEA